VLDLTDLSILVNFGSVADGPHRAVTQVTNREDPISDHRTVLGTGEVHGPHPGSHVDQEASAGGSVILLGSRFPSIRSLDLCAICEFGSMSITFCQPARAWSRFSR